MNRHLLLFVSLFAVGTGVLVVTRGGEKNLSAESIVRDESAAPSRGSVWSAADALVAGATPDTRSIRPDDHQPAMTRGAPAPEPTQQMSANHERPSWNLVRDGVRDSLLGDGFRADELIRDACGFNADSKFRPDYSSAEWNPAQKAISDQDRATLQSIADAYEWEITEKAVTAIGALQASLHDLWATGQYSHGETTGVADAQQIAATAQAKTSRGRFTYSDTIVTQGYEVTIRVDGGEYPDYELAMDALDRARTKRELELRSYIGMLP